MASLGPDNRSRWREIRTIATDEIRLPRSRRSPMRTMCPLLTVDKNGSRPSPGTVESEKLPFAMLLRCYWLNDSFAAIALVRGK